MTQTKITQLSLSASDQSTLQEFVASWGRHRHPVLFVGAGLSKHESERKRHVTGKSEFGSWWDLLADFQHALVGDDAKLRERLPADPLRLAQVYQTQRGRGALLDLVAKHVPSDDYLPGLAHRRLRDIPWAAVVTTNYDDLLERAFEPVRKVRVVISDEDLTQHRTLDDLLVVKMHGDLRRRDSIVLSEEDYRQYPATRPGISVKVRQLLLEHPLLFLGFSMTDPHFATIDGWIRDTVRSVRLPAVAIMHEEPIPAAYSMWKARGIELIRVTKLDALPQLLGALAAEARPHNTSRGQVFNRRVSDLEERAKRAAKDGGDTVVQELASCLRQIVTGATNDPDGGEAARKEMRWFCAGWHNVLRSHEASSQLTTSSAPPSRTNPISIREVLDQLNESERRTVLMFALEAGNEVLKVDRVVTPRIYDELLKDTATASRDELALIRLYNARILRNTGRTSEAQVEIDAGRTAAPSKRVASLLSAEIREILFQEGNAEKIKTELHRPPDENSDILAMCRRGADLLLLGSQDQALSCYNDALERAISGDEVHSALWGRIASLSEVAFSSRQVEREEEEREKLRAIPDSLKPRTVAARELLEDAGQALLDEKTPGRERSTAINKLLSYLNEARALGWPHSPHDNAYFPIERAARQTAQLLMQEEDVQRIKEGLALVCRYGLAGQVQKLFNERHRELLAGRQEDIEWFRHFAAERPTLPRAADARFTVAVCGIPLLEDPAIDDLVQELVSRTDAWRASTKSDQRSGHLMREWWEAAGAFSEHFPQGAARLALATIIRYLPSSDAMFRLRPSRLLLGLWGEQGFVLRGGIESRQFAESMIAAMADCNSRNGFWIVEVVELVCEAAAANLFDDCDRVALSSGAQHWLATLVAATPIDTVNVLRIVRLIDGLEPLGHGQNLAAFVPHAHALAIADIRTTSFELTWHCTRLVLEQMADDHRDELLSAVLAEGERTTAKSAATDNDRPLARALVDLERMYPSRREEIVCLVTRLAERNVQALAPFSTLREFAGEQANLVARLASRALFSSAEGRANCLPYIAEWLATESATIAGMGLLDTIVGLCASDSVETRVFAIVTLRTYFRAHPDSAPYHRASLVRSCFELARRDPSPRVRVQAIAALRVLVRSQSERDEWKAFSAESADLRTALERRLVASSRASPQGDAADLDRAQP